MDLVGWRKRGKGGEAQMELRDKGQEEEEGNENKAEWSEKSQEPTRRPIRKDRWRTEQGKTQQEGNTKPS